MDLWAYLISPGPDMSVVKSKVKTMPGLYHHSVQ